MSRFMRKGTTKIWFAPSLTNPAAPTVASVTGGTRLDTAIAEIAGFTFKNNPIDTPDMASTFVAKITGEDTVDDSSMTFYEDDTANPIMTALSKGATGYVVIFYAGIAGATPASGDKCEVWPVTISSNARMYTADNEAAKFQVSFATTAAPVAATVAS